MGVSFIKPWYSADLAMEVLENSMDARRILYALLIDSPMMILVSRGGMNRPYETEIWEYVTVRSFRIFRISLCVITNSESVPAVFVFSSPCAEFPHSFPHSVVQVYLVTGSFAKVWYFEIVSLETGWTTGAQKLSSSIAVLIFSSSRRMDWGKQCLGIVSQTVAVIAVNAPCKIILLFWNLGSGVYIFLLGSSSITSGCCGVPIRPKFNGVVLAVIVAYTGSCIAEHVVDFLLYFGTVLALFLARLYLGDSYHSGGCDLSSAGWVG